MNRRNIISLILFAWPALWLSAANSGDAAARLVSLGFENVVGNDPLGIGKPGNIFWHYDLQNRPNARDLKKAEYFLEEILEDYFLTADGLPRDPISLYSCIG